MRLGRKLWWVGGVLLALALALGGSMARYLSEVHQRGHMLGTVQYACRLYAEDHGGVMPPDVKSLSPKYLNSPPILAYASNEADYFPGATTDSSPITVLLRERRADWRGRRWVAYVDMSLDLVRNRPSRPAPP